MTSPWRNAAERRVSHEVRLVRLIGRTLAVDDRTKVGDVARRSVDLGRRKSFRKTSTSFVASRAVCDELRNHRVWGHD